MNKPQSVKYALHSMELEGFKFTDEEKAMWNKIGKGELPLEAAREDAREFDRQMRAKYPERFGNGER